ncbi:1-deoxy-D-xylulose-5-phosphate reductoisomerase [Candidatus Sulfidibacterium hydrothermale]|uniref:1-deoxy-D-xylulose-5-phosphate reductoisomerase n=1 Tax=Candidatus Sulfidibacterium hydrothermale TaxID=2875962 RepID=UPI001F0AADC7|nr:1-deoxy-D-xylulose-5-phosphate reductoisomerase [Candidatus Sulfidibacterium hydrothermale]UBM62204.1 1-deoxy-D-xylulose-5-phosphate reductoisomerase [Candidatus Sulfidibacterium hydrothermale]
MKKKIALFGSTGSIGKQTLEVIAVQSNFFEIEVLTANNRADLLIEQARQFTPNAVVIGNEDKYRYVADALQPEGIKVYAGEEAIRQIAAMESIDLAVMAILGFHALKPLLAILENKKPVALANKEALVIAGEIVMETARKNRVPVIPIDSEHAAIFQCLIGETGNLPEKIILTASGGPFSRENPESLANITPEQALQHPTWEMGPKTTIDSATLMNKGLEVMEARWLFGLKPHQIELLIHPQSVVHALVYFQDGAVKTLLSQPDMHIPIQYALSFPQRLQNPYPRLDLAAVGQLTFTTPDIKKFRNLALAFEAMEKGGNMPCILNAANEIAVEAFLQKKIGFMNIPDIIEKCMQTLPYVAHPTLENYFSTDKECRIKAKEYIQKTKK